jgi:hypothetical protein
MPEKFDYKEFRAGGGSPWLGDIQRFQQQGANPEWFPKKPDTFLGKEHAARVDEFLARLLTPQQFRDLYANWYEGDPETVIELDTDVGAIWGKRGNKTPSFIK